MVNSSELQDQTDARLKRFVLLMNEVKNSWTSHDAGFKYSLCPTGSPTHIHTFMNHIHLSHWICQFHGFFFFFAIFFFNPNPRDKLLLWKLIPDKILKILNVTLKHFNIILHHGQTCLKFWNYITSDYHYHSNLRLVCRSLALTFSLNYTKLPFCALKFVY